MIRPGVLTVLPRRRPRLLGALVVGGLLTGVVGLPSAASAADGLTLTEAAVQGDGTARVVATAPDGLSGRDLTGAFTATAAGRDVPVRVTRALSGAGLVLALDTSGGTAQLTAEQSAAADLLRGLPPTTPTTVLPGGRPTTALGALAVVGALRPGDAGLLDGLPATRAGRAVAVVLTGCPALVRETRSLPDDTQVSVLAVGAGCGTPASRLAGRAPGVVRTGLDTGRLFGAVDETARTLLGQYVLQTTSPVASGPLEVTLTDAGTTARASTPLTGPAAATAPATDAARTAAPGDDPPGWAVALAVALAVLAAGSLALELLARRRLRAAGQT